MCLALPSGTYHRVQQADHTHLALRQEAASVHRCRLHRIANSYLSNSCQQQQKDSPASAPISPSPQGQQVQRTHLPKRQWAALAALTFPKQQAEQPFPKNSRPSTLTSPLPQRLHVHQPRILLMASNNRKILLQARSPRPSPEGNRLSTLAPAQEVTCASA